MKLDKLASLVVKNMSMEDKFDLLCEGMVRLIKEVEDLRREARFDDIHLSVLFQVSGMKREDYDKAFEIAKIIYQRRDKDESNDIESLADGLSFVDVNADTDVENLPENMPEPLKKAIMELVSDLQRKEAGHVH